MLKESRNNKMLTTPNSLFTQFYNFNFSNPKILDKEHNLEKRLILVEMIEILNNKNLINKRSDIFFLFRKNF